MLIGARNSFLVGGKLSAKSYIQDGLVAMWDGIENAGWGVHDPNATTWKDLAGNRDMTLYSSYCQILENAMKTSGDGTAGVYVSLGNTTMCVEFCLKHNLSKSGLLLITGTQRSRNASTYYGYTAFTGNRTGCISTPVGEVHTVTCNYDSNANESDWTGYKDGESVSKRTDQETWQASYWGRFGGYSGFYAAVTVHSIRIYSKNLSTSEIAANYAVDKARFNLP